MSQNGLLGFHSFGTFMRNKILGILPNFQGKRAINLMANGKFNF